MLYIFALIVVTYSCKSEESHLKPSVNNCFSGEVVKSVRNMNGVVGYSTSEKKYSINISIPGTYDSNDIGLICESTSVPKKVGTKLSISGNYYSYSGDKKPSIGGETYYYLDVVSFSVSN